jgi:hypothetical protein
MKRGAALLLSIVIITLFLIISALLAKMVYNCYAGTRSVFTREQAYCYAEAGLEKGKLELTHNPNWFTALPYYLEDNASWLIKQAVGEEASFSEGSYKIVREKGKDHFYAVGYKGKGVVVLKLSFSGPPLRFTNWQEL